MNEINIIELFCGYGIISSSFKNAGFNTWKTDIRKRKGVCEPDIKQNIMEFDFLKVPFEKVHVLWASLPCDIWSYASGDFHWDGNSPKTKKCLEHIDILKKTLAVIDILNPDLFFIENPRGKLRDFPYFVDWLIKHRAVSKTLTYSSYGFPATKPTNIFTNATYIQFKELDKFGRGAKTNFKLDNISKGQKQKIPQTLSDEIVEYVQGFFRKGLIENKPRGSF